MYLIGKENLMKTLKNITAILNSNIPQMISKIQRKNSGANLIGI
jgi:hypothetical protein